jgi:hypothetical protein
MAHVNEADLPYDSHVWARITDFLSPTTVWQRRLWAIGTILSLRELVEAAEAVREGVLFDASFNYLWQETNPAVAQDPSFDPWLQTLRGQTPPDKVKVSEDSFRFDVIRLIIQDAEHGYLGRWAELLRGERRPRPERAARYIAAHLLDSGIHPQQLLTWWRQSAKPDRLADSVENAQLLLTVLRRAI